MRNYNQSKLLKLKYKSILRQEKEHRGIMKKKQKENMQKLKQF